MRQSKILQHFEDVTNDVDSVDMKGAHLSFVQKKIDEIIDAIEESTGEDHQWLKSDKEFIEGVRVGIREGLDDFYQGSNIKLLTSPITDHLDTVFDGNTISDLVTNVEQVEEAISDSSEKDDKRTMLLASMLKGAMTKAIAMPLGLKLLMLGGAIGGVVLAVKAVSSIVEKIASRVGGIPGSVEATPEAIAAKKKEVLDTVQNAVGIKGEFNEPEIASVDSLLQSEVDRHREAGSSSEQIEAAEAELNDFREKVETARATRQALSISHNIDQQSEKIANLEHAHGRLNWGLRDEGGFLARRDTTDRVEALTEERQQLAEELREVAQNVTDPSVREGLLDQANAILQQPDEDGIVNLEPVRPLPGDHLPRSDIVEPATRFEAVDVAPKDFSSELQGNRQDMISNLGRTLESETPAGLNALTPVVNAQSYITQNSATRNILPRPDVRDRDIWNERPENWNRK